MGSLRFEGVWFLAYPKDHEPSHVHGFYGEVRVVVDLLPGRKVRVSGRADAVTPSNGSKADVRHILGVAAKHVDELTALREKNNG
jgi:hypothetical protein